MQYTFSELELTYLLDLGDIQVEVTDDTLEEIDQAIEMIQGTIHEQRKSAFDNPLGDGCVAGDPSGGEGCDRRFESGQLTIPAVGVASK